MRTRKMLDCNIAERTPVSPQRKASLAMIAHRVYARHEFAEQAPLFRCRASLGPLRHRYLLRSVRRLARSWVSRSIAALRTRLSAKLRSLIEPLS
jgi:hypothetical protein